MLKKLMNQWFFTDVTPFLKKGFSRPISKLDLLELPSNSDSENNSSRFWDAWRKNGGSTKLTLKQLFRDDIRSISIVAVIHVMFAVATPIFLNRLLFSLGNQRSNLQNEPILLALGLFFSTLMLGLCNERIFHLTRVLALKVHGTVIGAIGYKISLQKKELNHGQLVNLVASDCWKIFELFVQRHRIWAVPIQVFLLLVLLLLIIGPSGLLGVSIMFAISPLSAVVITRLGRNRSMLLKISDRRISLITDGIKAIRSLKLSFNEKLLIKKTIETRDLEYKILLKRVFLTTLSGLIVLGSGTLVVSSSIILYVFLGNELTSASVFSTIALFGLLQTPIAQLSNGFRVFVESSKSLDRLDKFFKQNKINSIINNLEKNSRSIVLNCAEFVGFESKKHLHANFELPKNGLITLEGDSGIGKSFFFLL